MKKFFQSELYKHFWIFVIKTATFVAISNLLVALPFLGDPMFILVVIGGWGFAYGFCAAILGYWTGFALVKAKVPIPFNYLVVLIAVLAGLPIVYLMFTGGVGFSFWQYSSLIFPGIPFFLSVVYVLRISQRHIRPYVPKS